MANVRVKWVLPTTRESGKPLAVEDISHVRIEVSADGGSTYVLIDDFGADVLETLVQDLDFGVWKFRGLVADADGRVSQPVFGTIDIVPQVDDTPPGALLELTLTLE
jgi:hypothetical protein